MQNQSTLSKVLHLILPPLFLFITTNAMSTETGCIQANPCSSTIRNNTGTYIMWAGDMSVYGGFNYNFTGGIPTKIMPGSSATVNFYGKSCPTSQSGTFTFTYTLNTGKQDSNSTDVQCFIIYKASCTVNSNINYTISIKNDGGFASYCTDPSFTVTQGSSTYDLTVNHVSSSKTSKK
jgi:hypothetical protein